jgi:LPPG:FO 2-phospho-L-lactate transferase
VKVVALAGGIGGAKLIDGLVAITDPADLTVIVNTGDDFEHWGLYICPDLDTNMYWLSGLADYDRGWGLANESFNALERIASYGVDTWFQLGDRDLATHIARTEALKRGERLTDIVGRMYRGLGVEHRVVPMCDEPLRTVIDTRDAGTLSFQHWLVRERAKPAVRAVRFEGTRAPSDEVIDAIENADVAVIAPSNPYVSIDPILHLDGVGHALGRRPVVAVSPIVGGRAVKGPLAAMIEQLAGRAPCPAAVAAHYGPLVSAMVVERGDEADLDIRAHASETVMRTRGDRERLARETLQLAESLL